MPDTHESETEQCTVTRKLFSATLASCTTTNFLQSAGNGTEEKETGGVHPSSCVGSVSPGKKFTTILRDTLDHSLEGQRLAGDGKTYEIELKEQRKNTSYGRKQNKYA